MTQADLVKYALYACRPTMVKFLIQAGADVNAIEESHFGSVG